jgi:hypothetical protein
LGAEVIIHLYQGLRVYLPPSGHLSEGLIDLLQLIPANRPGLAVAQWHVSSHSDDLDMEISQEALVEAGLLEAIVFSMVLLRSGRSLDADAAEVKSSNTGNVWCGRPLAYM